MDKAMIRTIDGKKPGKEQEYWTGIIQAEHRLFDLELRNVWNYRDLLLLLVRRDFVATYKQTILGPIWFFLQPILTTLTFVLIFGRIAGLSTDGLPMLLFYLSGIILWNYFSECLTRTATVFKDNAAIFGKVYFPRLIMPLSIVISNLIKLLIQFALFLLIWAYYVLTDRVSPNLYILLTPLLVILLGGMSLGFGMIISAMTTRYRDLAFLLTFGIQLCMYATPVIYPISSIDQRFRFIIELNPLSSVIEFFRYGFLGSGTINWEGLAYSTFFMILVLLAGTVIFNRVEKSFMDTV